MEVLVVMMVVVVVVVVAVVVVGVGEVEGREEKQERGRFLSPGSSTTKHLSPTPIYIK